jgi:hypothetical protein
LVALAADTSKVPYTVAPLAIAAVEATKAKTANAILVFLIF